MQKIKDKRVILLTLVVMYSIITNVFAAIEIHPPSDPLIPIELDHPSINVDITSRSASLEDIKVVIKIYDDMMSPRPTYKYKFTNSTIKPSDGWIGGNPTVVYVDHLEQGVSQKSTGTWYLHAQAIDSDSNITTKCFGPYIKGDVGDTTKPVIILNGSSDVTVEVNSIYTDAGATASDNKDGNITGKIAIVNPVDTSKVGNYIIKYNVIDEAGNAATQITRTVHIVKAPDTTAPVITLNGSSDVTVEVNSIYTDAGATASDNKDGNITGKIAIVNPVDTSKVGNYIIKYNVIDEAENAATQVTRTVHIVEAPDTTAPVITLNGSKEIVIKVEDSYTDAGATAYDNKDEDITGIIAITGKDLVDTSKIEDYLIRYNVSDAAGNSAREVIRVVHVVESVSEYTGYAAFTKSSDRKYFRYYLGLDKRGIAILMLVAPAGDEVGETIEKDGFGKEKILDETYQFKNDIYYINNKGIIKNYIN